MQNYSIPVHELFTQSSRTTDVYWRNICWILTQQHTEYVSISFIRNEFNASYYLPNLSTYKKMINKSGRVFD